MCDCSGQAFIKNGLKVSDKVLEVVMYKLFVDLTFKAQHQLFFKNGVQEPLHEHLWKVCVAVSSERLNNDALVIDFEALKSMAEEC